MRLCSHKTKTGKCRRKYSKFSDKKIFRTVVANGRLGRFSHPVCSLKVEKSTNQSTPSSLFNCEDAPIEVYFCKELNFQTYLKVFLTQNFNTCHSINRNYIPRLYTCDKCRFESHFALKWLQHSVSCSETKEKPAKATSLDTCDQCGFTTKHKAYLKRHIAAHFVDEKDITWHKCSQCSYKAKHKVSLRNHIQTHHVDEKDVEWYECTKCPYKAKLKVRLRYHERKTHNC